MVNLNKLYVNPIVGVAVLKYRFFNGLLKATLNVCVCAMFLWPLTAKQMAASDIIVTSNIEDILVVETSSIPNGPGPKLDDTCKKLTVEPELKSAKLIFNKGWQITSQVVYGPYELVSFAGHFERIHTWCFADQTNIGIFHRDTLIGLINTTDENTDDLGSIELLETSQIAIIPTFIYDKVQSAVLTFRKNKISVDDPYYSMACELDGIIPDIYGLEIEGARSILFDYGWKPRNGKEIANMGDMQFGYSGMQDLTPELRVCGAGGFLRCYYNYENQGAFLEVVTSGEPEGTVSGVLGSCNID